MYIEAEKSLHMEGWKPDSQHITLAVTHTVVIKTNASFLPHTIFQHLPCHTWNLRLPRLSKEQGVAGMWQQWLQHTN